MNHKKLLGDAVKTARAKRNLTQLQLAENAGVSSRTITDMENYNGNPRFDTLWPVVRYLQLSVKDIFFPEQNGETVRTLIHQELSAFSEEELEVALKVLEGLRQGLHPTDTD